SGLPSIPGGVFRRSAPCRSTLGHFGPENLRKRNQQVKRYSNARTNGPTGLAGTGRRRDPGHPATPLPASGRGLGGTFRLGQEHRGVAGTPVVGHTCRLGPPPVDGGPLPGVGRTDRLGGSAARLGACTPGPWGPARLAALRLGAEPLRPDVDAPARGPAGG